MDERLIRMVRTLYFENKSLSIDVLASFLDCTNGTIKSTLSNNKEYVSKYGFELIEANDIRLEITDTNKFSFFLSLSDSNNDRVNEIILALLSNNGYIKIEDLAKEMYVSRATIDRLMPEVKSIMKKNRLELVSRAKYGISVQGNEINKRLCLARYKRTSVVDLFSDENASKAVVRMQSIITDGIEINGLKMNDINFYNLVQHSIIMITRIRRGNEITEVPNIQLDNDIEREKSASKYICDEFEKHFRISICNAERMYIVMHLLGKRIFQSDKGIREDVLDSINEIFNEIEITKDISFHGDPELMTSLALHIQPLISRMEFGLTQQNPLTHKIKKELSRGFELAICASEVIYRLYELQMSEDEVAYLAMYFALALEKRIKNHPKKKIALVCSTGKGTAKLLQFRLMEHFRYREEDIILTSLLHLDSLNYDEIECILTTIPLEKVYPVNVISIDLMFSDSSVKKVDNYFNSVRGIVLDETIKSNLVFSELDFDNREEILKYMCMKVEEVYGINLYEQVMKRELLSSTEVGNKTAYPHPYQYDGEQLIICAASLKKPVKWKYGNVQFVLLLCYPLNDEKAESVSNAFASLALRDDIIEELIDDLSCDRLIQILRGD